MKTLLSLALLGLTALDAPSLDAPPADAPAAVAAPAEDKPARPVSAIPPAELMPPNVRFAETQLQRRPLHALNALGGMRLPRIEVFVEGTGHVLHVMCDLTIAADNAIFGQVGPKMGSFDGGFGSSYLARMVGQKKAREIWFLCRQYNATEALGMGLVNKVEPVAQLEDEGVAWSKEILQRSPLAIRCLKAAFNAELDGQSGIQELAGNATMLYYMTEEAKEFMTAQKEKRKPQAEKFPWLP
jgi:hypothetical protein